MGRTISAKYHFALRFLPPLNFDSNKVFAYFELSFDCGPVLGAHISRVYVFLFPIIGHSDHHQSCVGIVIVCCSFMLPPALMIHWQVVLSLFCHLHEEVVGFTFDCPELVTAVHVGWRHFANCKLVEVLGEIIPRNVEYPIVSLNFIVLLLLQLRCPFLWIEGPRAFPFPIFIFTAHNPPWVHHFYNFLSFNFDNF